MEVKLKYANQSQGQEISSMVLRSQQRYHQHHLFSAYLLLPLANLTAVSSCYETNLWCIVTSSPELNSSHSFVPGIILLHSLWQAIQPLIISINKFTRETRLQSQSEEIFQACCQSTEQWPVGQGSSLI